MDASRRVDPVVLVGELDGAVESAGARTVTVSDREQRAYSGRTRPLQHRLAILRELSTFNVGVRVDEHGESGDRAIVPTGHRKPNQNYRFEFRWLDCPMTRWLDYF